MSKSTYLNNVLTHFKMQGCKPTLCYKLIVDENSESLSRRFIQRSRYIEKYIYIQV